jgi:hypothetical protein
MWVGCPVVASSAGGTIELLEPDAMHNIDDLGRLEQLIGEMLSSHETSVARVSRNWKYSSRFDPMTIEATRIEFWREFADFTKASRRSRSWKSGAQVF